MSFNAGKDIGKMLGKSMVQQETISDNLSPNDTAIFNLQFKDSIELNGNVKVYQKFIASDSFVLDHPVQGELDSSVYKLDGGYAESSPGHISFPMVFPAVFEGGEAGTILLYSYDF